MTATASTEYNQMELESSNLFMEWDGRWVQGQYEEAAVAALQAGTLRLRMGNLCAEAGNLSQAAEDWLSAADAYLHATNTDRASLALRHARAVEERGVLPAERVDIPRTLRQYEDELAHLEEAIRSLGKTLQARGWSFDVPDPAALEFLLQSVREFPGLAVLHYSIARQAAGLGRQDVADAHLFWATVFDPLNESFFAQLMFNMIRSARVKEARKLAEVFLSRCPQAGVVRVLLAIALASDLEAPAQGLEQAAAVLEPLTGAAQADTLVRAGGLAVSVEVRREQGRSEEAARLLGELAELEQGEGDPQVKAAIAELHSAAAPSPPRTVAATPDGSRNGSPNHNLLHLAELLMPLPA